MKRAPGFAVGMPTAVDVTRLMEAFGVPSEGTRISYEDIERLLSVTPRQSRFWSVTAAWRRKLEREHNLLIEAVPGEGFDVLTNRGRVGFTARDFKSGLRKVTRAGERAAKTSRVQLSPQEVRVLDYQSQCAAQWRVQAAVEARKLRELPPGVESGQK